MEHQEKQHKRRVRYSGTHPRSYKEKYKEHNPGKVFGHHREGHSKRRNPGGNAYFHYGKGNY